MRTTSKCPYCGRAATYVEWADRFYHKRPGDDVPCWLKIARGEVEERRTR
jgi:hypothetical protein